MKQISFIIIMLFMTSILNCKTSENIKKPIKTDVSVTQSIPVNHIRIHHTREKGDYEKLVMWAWADTTWILTEWPKGKPWTGQDSTGVYWDVPVKEGTGKLGFLFVNGETGDKDGADKGVTYTKDSREFWCIQGTDNVTKEKLVPKTYINFEKPKDWTKASITYKINDGKETTLNMDEYRPNWFSTTPFIEVKKLSFYLSDGNKNKTVLYTITKPGSFWLKNGGKLSEKDLWIEPKEGIVFNSRDTKYKSPYGAVPVGTEVSYKFESLKGALTSANLVLEKQLIIGDRAIEYKEYKTLPMSKTSLDNKDWWEAKYKFDNENVYGYYFEIYIGNYKRILSGAGEIINVEHYKLPKTGGFAVKNSELPNEGQFIQTVYKKDFKTPDWAKDVVYYYIFPERFRNGDKSNDPKVGKDFFYDRKPIEFHENWNDEKPWVPGKNDGIPTDNEYCNDFYGGDLAGIIEKLDYLKELGINTIYTTPIFEAPSNHKYDTADYMKIDNNFGTLEEFKKLTSEAKKRGIRVILDASINHTGSDSVYMDRYGKYEGIGAFENEVIRKDSPYYDWYLFNENATNPDQKYNQWANPTLATLNPNSQSFREFAFRNENSVMKYWLKQGTAGWRMDVAPWKPDDFWKEWRTEIKKANPDALTVAETWWDSSKYFLGDMFDSTMNYIFRATLFEYAKGNYTAEKTNDILEMMRENYPEEAFYVLMNLMSTHDSARALWHFGYKERNDKSNYEKAVAKLKMSMLFQMTYPGSPAIFYGDEVGVTGGNDPFNRGPYPWEDMGGNPDMKLLEEVKGLLKIRNNNAILRRGTIEPIYADENVIVNFREYEGKKAIILVNNSDKEKTITIKVDEKLAGKYLDVLNNGDFEFTGNEVKITVKAHWGNVFITR